jgi:RNA polymerase sigma-70 factor (ECF subfamily)
MTPDSTRVLPAAAVSALCREATPVRNTPRQLFEAHAGFVLRLVRHLGVHDGDAEDVTQEVFMIVHRRIADLNADSSARSWLFGIARRVVANYLRKVQRRREHVGSDPCAEQADPADALQLARDRALLQRALDRLDADKRAVFVLFELEGVAMNEVATMVGCPLHTAYSRLYAARALVQRHVLGPRGRSQR